MNKVIQQLRWELEHKLKKQQKETGDAKYTLFEQVFEQGNYVNWIHIIQSFLCKYHQSYLSAE